jgi:hypothetical protein
MNYTNLKVSSLNLNFSIVNKNTSNNSTYELFPLVQSSKWWKYSNNFYIVFSLPHISSGYHHFYTEHAEKALIPLLFSLQVCSNEATCICDFTWAGTDCSIRDPVRNPPPPKDEGPKGLCDFIFTSLHTAFIHTRPMYQYNTFIALKGDV